MNDDDEIKKAIQDVANLDPTILEKFPRWIQILSKLASSATSRREVSAEGKEEAE